MTMSNANKRVMKRIATVLISALSLATAVAQEESPEENVEEEEVRRYTVEVIVFSYEEEVSVGSELFFPDEPPAEEDLLADEEAGDIKQVDAVEDEFTVEEVDAEVEESEFGLVLLTEEELILGDAARQFELLDAYETILHVGWTQPTYPEEETSPIELRTLGEPPDGLNGTFRLYLSRYLHLVVDLALDAPVEIDEAVFVDDSFFDFGDARPRIDDSVDPAPLPVRYLIQENRIVKNGELRYFDHPKFGVLAKITRVEEDEDDEFGEDELPDPLISFSGQ
jgi:Peptidoglycan-binding protein, CsiV